MNIKENLQFLAMLIPTFLLLAALLFSLAAAATELTRGAAALPAGSGSVVVQDTESGPVQAIAVGPE
jgi:hypothetical protein